MSATLLRGVIDFGDGTSRESLQANWHRLHEAEVKWLNPSDERLYSWLKTFQIYNNDVPAVGVVEDFFERDGDIEAVERLKDVRAAKVWTHGNFAHVLKEHQARTQTADALTIFKTATEIAVKGLVIEDRGQKTKLQGPQDALAFALREAAAQCQSETNGTRYAHLIKTVPKSWFEHKPPERSWLLKDNRTGEGVLVQGKVGMLVAEGGAGKTMAVTQAALSIATGTPWLSTFAVPNPGRVLLVLGEEEDEEVHRRLNLAASVEGIEYNEELIDFLALQGHHVPFIENQRDGTSKEGAFLVFLREYVRRNGPYVAIIIDPVSRFAGSDAEKDNAAGTRFCQALESLVKPAGRATVIACHHTNKVSRPNNGQSTKVTTSSARGSSSLTDGVRWVATMSREDFDASESIVTCSVTKSNYAMRPQPIELRYGEGGVLLLLEPDQQAAAQQARQEAAPSAKRQRARDDDKANRNAADDAAVVDAVRLDPGVNARALRGRLQAELKCGVARATGAIERTVAARTVRRVATNGSVAFFIGQEAVNGAALRTDDREEMEDLLSKYL